jgi:aminoglycoside phosphotransferase family enzyme
MSAAAIPSLADKVAALARASLYPDRPTAVEVIQTHFAFVFLTGHFAYKLKKPIKVHGADLTTTDARARACREELRLNQRISAATYLDVVPLTVSAAGLVLGGPGPPVDWLVRMRQLPRSQMLDDRLRRNRVRREDLAAVVAALASFYRSAPAELLPPAQALRGIEARIAEALTELGRAEFALPAGAVAAFARQLDEVLPRVRPLLRLRASEGRLREAHGDLRAEHVCLGPPVQIIDALEISRELRVLDPAEDLAMLAVDLERHGGAWTAPELIDAYRQIASDPLPDALWFFYCGLRAATRAKVAIWHLESPDEYPDAEAWRRTTLTWLACAAAWLDRCLVTDPV